MTLPKLGDWIYAAKTFAAAMLALYLGFALSVPRPYWAMATVYICSNPLAGATRSKAAFRLLGTLIGATAAVVLVPNLAASPELLTLALALWVGLCVYLALLDRSPRAYVFLLGGYTAALIGFPAVGDPSGLFDVAVARSEAIGLGIVCSSLVSTLVLPRTVGDTLAARVDAWIGAGARLGRDALDGRASGGAAVEADLTRLAGDLAEIDMLSTHLAYDTSGLRERAAALGALRLRMAMMLPVLSSLADRMGELRDVAPSPAVAAAISGLRDWISPAAPSTAPADIARDVAAATALRARFAAAAPRLDAAAGWHDMLVASLLMRLRDTLDLAEASRALRRTIATGRGASDAVPPPAVAVASARHVDRLMPLLSAVGVAVAVLLNTGFWVATGWPDGASAPMMAATAMALFANRDDPTPALVEFTVWSAVAIAVMGVYLFAILPLASNFEMVALALAPAFLVFGVMMAVPATAGKGLVVAFNGATLLALQGSYAADFTAYANTGVAFMVGLSSAAVLTAVLRAVGAAVTLGRLGRADGRTLAEAARGRGRGDRARVAGLMLDRLSLAAPRLAALPAGEGAAIRRALAAPRIGLNIVDLRGARHGLAAGPRAAVDRLLDRLARHVSRTALAPDPALLAELDAALGAVVGDAPVGASPAGEVAAASGAASQAVLGLVGLRRALFPAAPPYAAAPLAAPFREAAE